MEHGRTIAILGGGQLGRMFIENALRYNVNVHILDPSENAPCAHIADTFHCVHFNDTNAVLQAAKDVDVISIEIEHVSTDALDTLDAQGKIVVPSTLALQVIKDKGLQKRFYTDNDIPTAPYILAQERDELRHHTDMFPAFLKARTGGYDGKGVVRLNSVEDIDGVFEGPYILEKETDIAKELGVIVARGLDGEMAHFDPVEMVFDEKLNLVDHLLSPAQVPDNVLKSAIDLAYRVVNGLKSPGIFAVELFLTKSGEVIVNETAPRVHNSGHHTIESCPSSQFDQFLRILMGWPLGETNMNGFAAMVNLIGEQGNGAASIEGIDDLMKIPDAYLHLYGKEETRTGRKMGHVTVLGESLEEVELKVKQVKKVVRIIPRTEPVKQ